MPVIFFTCKSETKEKTNEVESVQTIKEKFDWKEYVYDDGNFAIQFPGNPEVTDTIQSTKDYGVVKIHSFLYAIRDNSDKNVVYQASYDILPNTIKSDSIEEFFNDLSEMLIYHLGDNGKIISNRSITYNTFPGREVQYEITSINAIGVEKYYLVNKKYYSIQTITYRANYPNAAMENFFNSFKLIDQK